MMTDSVEWNHGSPIVSIGVLQHNHPLTGHMADIAESTRIDPNLT